MKIGIVTVFKAENCGSFLQAWALQETLSSMGGDVYFCDYKSPYTFTNKIVNTAKCCLRFNLKRASNIWSKSKSFKACREELNVMSFTDRDVDVYFFGSDTLWNFDDEFFRKEAAFFTGANIQTPCYTYAMSIGSTSKETFLKNGDAIDNIRKFKSIAVRDEYSKSVLANVYPEEKMLKTVDPTLLLDAETYVRHFGKAKADQQKSLLVYYFGAIPATLWEELRHFAQERGLQLVNVGMHEPQYDRSVVPVPENFINEFYNADYVFTNTFHGCVFSVVFQKQFITNGINKKKIESFLNDYELTDRAIGTAQDVSEVLQTPIDYGKVNTLLEERRNASIDYLNSIICEEGNHE